MWFQRELSDKRMSWLRPKSLIATANFASSILSVSAWRSTL
jgi:hypothetical protein